MTSVLFLIGTYPNYGGTEKVTTFLANRFNNDGHFVGIASFSQPHLDLLSELNSSVLLLSLSYPVLSKGNVRALTEFIENNNIDVIINQWALPFNTNRLCRKSIGRGRLCKIISVYHNAPDMNARVSDLDVKLSSLSRFNYISKASLYFRRFFTSLIIRLSMNLVYKNSDQYVILSKSFEDIFKKYAFVKDSSKLSVITNPITIPLSFSSVQKENLIIYVGRLDFIQKRVERIIDIWDTLHRQFHDWKLEIVGDGPELNRLKSIVSERNIERVEFAGYQDPLNYYKRASFLLLTSEYEGFGLVIVEGMSYGVIPVVYGSYTSVYDIIEDGRSGIIVEKPYDKMKFVNEIGSVILDNVKKKILSDSAILDSHKFTLDEVSQKWYSLFDKLIKA